MEKLARSLTPVVAEAGDLCDGHLDEAPRTEAERMGPDLLATINKITGGRVFPIHGVEKIGSATAELSVELRNQYLMAYRPSNLTHDGKWHKISVFVTPPQHSSRLRAYAKAGNCAPPE